MMVHVLPMQTMLVEDTCTCCRGQTCVETLLAADNHKIAPLTSSVNNFARFCLQFTLVNKLCTYIYTKKTASEMKKNKNLVGQSESKNMKNLSLDGIFAKSVYRYRKIIYIFYWTYYLHLFSTV